MGPQQGSLGSVPSSAPQVGSAPAPAPSPHRVPPQGHPPWVLRDFSSILAKNEMLIFPSFFFFNVSGVIKNALWFWKEIYCLWLWSLERRGAQLC